MIKQLTSYLEYGVFAEVSLAIFAVVFVAIVIRTLMLRQETTEQVARIVLGDNVPNDMAPGDDEESNK